ncbi:MAG: deoxynucleoside kinase [Candidatus Eisenbacteria sp.]|nr:deoxynucleoside kinase [Candidatus Eisenbacteria bacterium]
MEGELVVKGEQSTPLYFIAIEGVIGVGKTSLAKRLADYLGGCLLLEQVEENPFLQHFYQDRRAYAFQTQIFFLLCRYRQQREFLQRDLFRGPVVSDYMFQKDRVFANINLSDSELDMYNQIFTLMERDQPRPDRVIFLRATVDTLLDRISKRDREYEKEMDPEYLETLAEAYTYFFAHYTGAPVMVVNSNELDFRRDLSLVSDLWKAVIEHRAGTAVYNPPSD